MTTVDRALVRASPEAVYRLAAEVERWPEFLPHYRSVRVVGAEGGRRRIEMRCVRPFGPVLWPCRWQADMELIPDERRILYHHVKGPTRGMRVEWSVRSTPEGVAAAILHEFELPLPVLGKAYTDLVVGPVFVHAIAQRTLAGIKAVAEGEE